MGFLLRGILSQQARYCVLGFVLLQKKLAKRDFVLAKMRVARKSFSLSYEEFSTLFTRLIVEVIYPKIKIFKNGLGCLSTSSTMKSIENENLSIIIIIVLGRLEWPSTDHPKKAMVFHIAHSTRELPYGRLYVIHGQDTSNNSPHFTSRG